MQLPEIHYRWEWDLASSPEQFWDWIADTNRFNQDAGVPWIQQVEGGSSLKAGHRLLRLKAMGVPVEWEEEPFEWIRPQRFGVVRRYRSGPMAQMRVLVDLQPREAGSRLVYQVWARPANWLGRLGIPLQIGWVSARNFSTTIRRYDRLASAQGAAQLPPGPIHFTPGGPARLTAALARLHQGGGLSELLDPLAHTLRNADDLSVSRLRPYALADAWGRDRHAVLEMCLLATRVGLLDLFWEVLCPLCRGSQKSTSRLSEIDSRVHCDSCNIDFSVAFDRLVELTFRPNPSIRPGASQQFCLGGPQLTPHIVLQQRLQPGEQRELTVPLEPGRYRLRALEMAGILPLQVAAQGPPQALLRATSTGWATEEVMTSSQPVLQLHNATTDQQLFILERTAWSDQAVTAAEVMTRQTFRDLFSSEALRPGEKISVGSMTVAFTDLRNSTPMYREIGDAPAFGVVMEHFEVLRQAMATEGGALVKTIGDAVMAVFLRPASALRAFVRAQRQLASPPEGRRPLYLKVGLHTGPCIAVTLNERLDYFGSTVNVAARLEGLSSGSDLVVSEAVYNDPEVPEALESLGLIAEPFESGLKGFDQERFRLWRLKPRPAPALP